MAGPWRSHAGVSQLKAVGSWLGLLVSQLRDVASQLGEVASQFREVASQRRDGASQHGEVGSQLDAVDSQFTGVASQVMGAASQRMRAALWLVGVASQHMSGRTGAHGCRVAVVRTRVPVPSTQLAASFPCLPLRHRPDQRRTHA